MTQPTSMFLSLSFSDILYMSYDDWRKVSNARFKRTDTGELLGEIHAKYPIESGKMSAIMNDGRVEFLLRGQKDRYTLLFGTQIGDINKPIFVVENTISDSQSSG